jgi:hypothetical protein
MPSIQKTYTVTVDKVPEYVGKFQSSSPSGAARKVITALIKTQKLKKGKVTTKATVVEVGMSKPFMYKLSHKKLEVPHIVNHGGTIISHAYKTDVKAI